ncbi:glycosyltransferase [Sphingobacterium kyonggiense]
MGKIIYIGAFELPDKNAAAQRILGNSKAFQDLGYEVILIGLSKGNVHASAFNSNGFVSYEEKYPVSNKEWVKYLFDINFVKRIIFKEKPEIIVLYNYPAYKLFRLTQLCKRLNIKLYADITEWYMAEGRSVKSLIKRIDIQLRMKILHFKLDGLIVISSFLKSYYSNKIKNIIIVPPLIDNNDEKWMSSNPNIKEGNSLIKFVYSGSPGSGGKDRLDIVIENLKKVREELNQSIQFDIIGINEEEYAKNFQISHAKDDFVKFYGRLSHKDAIKIVKKSHFSVFFRDNYIVNNAGFPTKFVESITLGTPVITNATSDLPYYYKKYGKKLGVIIPDLSKLSIKEGLVRAIKYIHSNSSEDKSIDSMNQIFDYRNFLAEFKSLLEGGK